MNPAEYGRPRRVPGGLKAHSVRGTIGASWWSRRFIEVLESFALGTRLTRGRSYARAGQVLSLDIGPGQVTASVQGSHARPYQVSIGLPTLTDDRWARVERTLAGQALFSARLLAGDLPAELEQVFTAAGAPLFPGSIGELRLRCDCPDPAVPCKHLAATCYLFAEALDADPFQLLHWRGRDRATLLDRLRALRPGSGDAAPDGAARVAAPQFSIASEHRTAGAPNGAADAPDVSSGGAVVAQPPGAGPVLAEVTGEPLSATVDRFWLPPVPLPARPSVVAAEPDLVLRQLGSPAPAIGGPGLVERFRRAYRRFGADGR